MKASIIDLSFMQVIGASCYYYVLLPAVAILLTNLRICHDKPKYHAFETPAPENDTCANEAIHTLDFVDEDYGQFVEL